MNNDQLHTLSGKKKFIEVEECKQIELRILAKFAEYCDLHNLKYYLAYGTLLGAIRHQGFIPWDDDIDVCMPREDYEYLLNNFNADLEKGEFYELIDPFSKKGIHTFIKIIDNRTLKIENGVDYSKKSPLGIDIDVFPLDGWVSEKNVKNRYRLNRIIFRFVIIANLPTKNKSPIKRSIIKFFKLFRAGFIRLLHYRATKVQFGESEFVGVQVSMYSKHIDCYSRELFKDRMRISFEGNQFWAPSGYDEYLSSNYGNYMSLPPEEKRVTHHSNVCYWR